MRAWPELCGLHGLNAVAELKPAPRRSPPPARRRCLHGLNAVAELKPRARRRGVPPRDGPPPPPRRGRIEASRHVRPRSSRIEPPRPQRRGRIEARLLVLPAFDPRVASTASTPWPN